MADDKFKSLWRDEFTCFAHPNLLVRSSLVELLDKLSGAAGFLETLSEEVEIERERGLFVAELAVNYANDVLAVFGILSETKQFVPTSLREGEKKGDTHRLGGSRGACWGYDELTAAWFNKANGPQHDGATRPVGNSIESAKAMERGAGLPHVQRCRRRRDTRCDLAKKSGYQRAVDLTAVGCSAYNGHLLKPSPEPGRLCD